MRYYCILILLVFCISPHAHTVCDTLKWDENSDEMVIISYDIQAKDEVVTIKFKKPRIMMSHFPKKWKAWDIKVLFFDKHNDFKDMALNNDGITSPDCMKVPDGVNLEDNHPKAGFYVLNDDVENKLMFRLNDNQVQTLSIPIYLAHYENFRKGKTIYYLFSPCGNLEVSLKKEEIKAATSPSGSYSTQTLLNPRIVEEYDTIIKEEGPVDPTPPEIVINHENDNNKEETENNKEDQKAQDLGTQIDELRLNIQDAKSLEKLEEYKNVMNKIKLQIKEYPQLLNDFNNLESQYMEKAKVLENEENKQCIIKVVLGVLAILFFSLLMFVLGLLLSLINRNENKKVADDMMKKASEEAQRASMGIVQKPSVVIGRKNESSGFMRRIFDRLFFKADNSLKNIIKNGSKNKRKSSKKPSKDTEQPSKVHKSAGSTGRNKNKKSRNNNIPSI